MIYIQQAINSPLGRHKRGSPRGFRRGPGKHSQGTSTPVIPILGDILDNLLDFYSSSSKRYSKVYILLTDSI